MTVENFSICSLSCVSLSRVRIQQDPAHLALEAGHWPQRREGKPGPFTFSQDPLLTFVDEGRDGQPMFIYNSVATQSSEFETGRKGQSNARPTSGLNTTARKYYCLDIPFDSGLCHAYYNGGFRSFPSSYLPLNVNLRRTHKRSRWEGLLCQYNCQSWSVWVNTIETNSTRANEREGEVVVLKADTKLGDLYPNSSSECTYFPRFLSRDGPVLVRSFFLRPSQVHRRDT
ncbi:hypothetical protein C8R45DRAFT_934695 [Mycena sanguinolenta]|nr:hypothetical protein C8R45DRAFT_934695 [Mycena sanguinolenta]